jgi:hypothetical protein
MLGLDREWWRDWGDDTTALALAFLRSKPLGLWTTESLGELVAVGVLVTDGEESARTGLARTRFELSDPERDEELMGCKSRRVVGGELLSEDGWGTREVDIFCLGGVVVRFGGEGMS